MFSTCFSTNIKSDTIPTTKTTSGFVFIDTAMTSDHGLETMVFACDSEGQVESWSDLDVNHYESNSEAIAGHEKMVNKWKAVSK